MFLLRIRPWEMVIGLPPPSSSSSSSVPSVQVTRKAMISCSCFIFMHNRDIPGKGVDFGFLRRWHESFEGVSSDPCTFF